MIIPELKRKGDKLSSGYVNINNVKWTEINNKEIAKVIFNMVDKIKKQHKSVKSLSPMDYFNCVKQAQLAHTRKELGK